MKAYFERQIDYRTYAFTRITFPQQDPWYRVELSGDDQSLSFWMKQGGEGQWKIQPQLLAEDIWKREEAFAQFIAEHETMALHQD